MGSSTSSTADRARETVAQASTSIAPPSAGSIMICSVPPPLLMATRTSSKPMPTTVGATISSIRRSNSVTRGLGSQQFWAGGLPTNEKSGFWAHSFLFGSSREPDEDGADIGAVLPKSKGIRRILWAFVQTLLLVVVQASGPSAAGHKK